MKAAMKEYEKKNKKKRDSSKGFGKWHPYRRKNRPIEDANDAEK